MENFLILSVILNFVLVFLLVVLFYDAEEDMNDLTDHIDHLEREVTAWRTRASSSNLSKT